MIKTLKAFTLHAPSVSVGLVFSTMSLLYGSWIARIPEIQARLGMNESQLGFTLLGLSAGALVVTPFSGWLLKKFSTGKAVIISSMLTCAVLPLVAFAPSIGLLVVVFVLLGLCNSMMNVAMNAAAAAVEQAYRVRIMSTCHGMFSLGGFVGASSSGLVASLGVPLTVHLSGLAFLLIGLNMALRPALLDLPEGNRSGATFILPTKGLLVLSAIGFCIMLGEGAIADWSAVFLKNYLDSSAFVAGLGYAAFCFAMAAGRFYGDIVRLRFSAKSIISFGSLAGSAGLLMAVLAPVPMLAVIGFAMTGVGFSVVVPILFGEAAKSPGVSPGTGIATVVTAGTVGFLTGPPLIGVLGQYLGLSVGLAMVAVLAIGASAVARKI